MARRRPCAREPGPSLLFFFLLQSTRFCFSPCMRLAVVLFGFDLTPAPCLMAVSRPLFFSVWECMCHVWCMCVCACVRVWEHECILGPSAPVTRGRPCGRVDGVTVVHAACVSACLAAACQARRRPMSSWGDWTWTPAPLASPRRNCTARVRHRVPRTLLRVRLGVSGAAGAGGVPPGSVWVAFVQAVASPRR